MEYSPGVEKKKVLDCGLPLFDRPCPWLIFAHGEDKHIQTFYNVSEDRRYTRQVPLLRNKLIYDVGGSNGWLFLKEKKSTYCCLFNIVTNEQIELPPFTEKTSMLLGSCLVTSNPNSPNCSVLIYNLTDDQYVLSCRIGDDSFIKKYIVAPTNGDHIHRVTMVQGKVYGLSGSTDRLVVCEDIYEPNCFSDVGVEQSCELIDVGRPCLVESCGEVLLVLKEKFSDEMYDTTRFTVFQPNFVDKIWMEVKDIGERAIFFDFHKWFSCSTVGLKGVRQNCIYFLEKGDRNMYVFDLGDQSFSVRLPCPNVSSRNLSKQSWVLFPSFNVA